MDKIPDWLQEMLIPIILWVLGAILFFIGFTTFGWISGGLGFVALGAMLIFVHGNVLGLLSVIIGVSMIAGLGGGGL